MPWRAREEVASKVRGLNKGVCIGVDARANFARGGGKDFALMVSGCLKRILDRIGGSEGALCFLGACDCKHCEDDGCDACGGCEGAC